MDEIFSLIKKEEKRQKESITLIPSENYPSQNVLNAEGSILMAKYAEGYPEHRYYQGNRLIDKVESLAIERAKELFDVPYANVQPYSGSPANAAVLFGLMELGDTVCGLKLSGGGHLTHGHPDITFSGKYFKPVQYDVEKDGHLDYGKITALVKKTKPRIIFAGTTAYPFELDFKKFGEIADLVDAYLVADISHIAGLVVGGVHQDPADYAHIITTTTHKTLRGPRGAMILVTDKGLQKNRELPSLIDNAVFPGLQGGPHEHTIAATAVCLNEASKKSFGVYAKGIVKNAKALAGSLQKKGIKIFGTQNHLMVCDFSSFAGGAQMAHALEIAGIIVNKNTIPHDSNPPFYPSGIRIGTPAVTTRGMGEGDMEKIADWIFRVYELVREWKLPEKKEERVGFIKKFRKWADKNSDLGVIKREVVGFAKTFPLYKKT